MVVTGSAESMAAECMVSNSALSFEPSKMYD
jgi:hypothetical protein